MTITEKQFYIDLLEESLKNNSNFMEYKKELEKCSKVFEDIVYKEADKTETKTDQGSLITGEDDIKKGITKLASWIFVSEMTNALARNIKKLDITKEQVRQLPSYFKQHIINDNWGRKPITPDSSDKLEIQAINPRTDPNDPENNAHPTDIIISVLLNNYKINLIDISRAQEIVQGRLQEFNDEGDLQYLKELEKLVSSNVKYNDEGIYQIINSVLGGKTQRFFSDVISNQIKNFKDEDKDKIVAIINKCFPGFKLKEGRKIEGAGIILKDALLELEKSNLLFGERSLISTAFEALKTASSSIDDKLVKAVKDAYNIDLPTITSVEEDFNMMLSTWWEFNSSINVNTFLMEAGEEETVSQTNDTSTVKPSPTDTLKQKGLDVAKQAVSKGQGALQSLMYPKVYEAVRFLVASMVLYTIIETINTVNKNISKNEPLETETVEDYTEGVVGGIAKALVSPFANALGSLIKIGTGSPKTIGELVKDPKVFSKNAKSFINSILRGGGKLEEAMDKLNINITKEFDVDIFNVDYLKKHEEEIRKAFSKNLGGIINQLKNVQTVTLKNMLWSLYKPKGKEVIGKLKQGYENIKQGLKY